MHRIRDEFYGGGDRFAVALPAGHAPVHYVRFGIEHADVTESREPLYAAISPRKRVCDFASVSHYFNTLSVRGFALVDTRTVRRTSYIFSPGARADAVCGRRPRLDKELSSCRDDPIPGVGLEAAAVRLAGERSGERQP